MQSTSFLAHRRRLALAQGLGRSSCQTCRTLLAMNDIPGDNHIRAMTSAP